MNKKKTVGYLEDIPRPKINNAWDEKLNNYIWAKHKSPANALRMVLNFLNFCKIESGTLLEIGCGSGWFRRYIKGVTYTGLEVLIRKDINIDFPMVVGIGEKLPFKNESVDHVLIYATLDHVSNPLQVLKESFRVLKKDGNIFILSTVKISNSLRKIFVYSFLLFQKILFFDYESIIRNFKQTVLKEEDKFHTFEFTAEDIKAMLSETGYSGLLLKNFLNTCFFKANKPKIL